MAYTDTVVGTQLDPQYGWVTADPKNSTGFNPITAAKNLYSSMYSSSPLAYNYTIIKPSQTGGYQSPIGGPTTQTKDYSNLMNWYYAASNPMYNQGGAYKGLMDLYSQGLSQKTYDRLSTSLGSGGTKTPFGQVVVDRPYSLALQALTKQYGQAAIDQAKADIMRASAINPKELYPNAGFAEPISKPVQEYQRYFDQQGGVPKAYDQITGSPLTAYNLFNEKDRRNTLTGSAYLASFDPNLYGNATLRRYFEGSNPDLLSVNGMPWIGRENAKNLSWTGGGEFMTDEAFNYYKNKSTQGTAGTSWTPVGTNSNLLSGTFDGRQAFFTPYEYAIKGIPDEQAKVTNISAADPNFWAQQGNLQNINNQWGFVTQQDPYAGMATSNIALNPDTLTATLRRSKGPGWFSSFINALPSIGLGLIPGIGAFSALSSGIQGIGAAANFFDKDKQQNSLASWYQPSIYNNWKPY